MTTALVTGGAGFLGSHLSRRLLDEGWEVVVLDSLLTGRAENVADLMPRDAFRFERYDVTNYLHVDGLLDWVLHLASPASPADYLEHPIHTLKVGALGTLRALGLAKAKGAGFFLASTSEVYGDPQVHPQPESYWGHVNPVGPRGVYDEAKRYAEAMTAAYRRAHGVSVRVARIFNSVLATEQVLYDDGHELRRESVGKLAGRLAGRLALPGFTVPAFDSDARMVTARASALVGHPPAGTCFEVRTRYGRSIRVTGDHSLFVRGEDGRPMAEPVRNLTVGSQVALARRVDVTERDRPHVDLREVWDATGGDPWQLWIRGDGLGQVAWTCRQQIFALTAGERRPPGPNWRNTIWSSISHMRATNQIPLAVMRRLGIDSPPDAIVLLRRGGRTAPLPMRVPVSDELLWFFGLYVAEGCFYRNEEAAFITVSGSDDLLRKAAKIIERDLGLHVVSQRRTAARAAAIYVHSVLLLRLLDRLGLGSGPKRIPGWILGLPLDRLKWFLEGYREGDGVHSGIKFAEGVRHEFSTTSEELKDDLVVALARFGIVASVGRYTTTFRQRTGNRRYPFWRLTIPWVRPWSPLDWDQGIEQHLQAESTGDLVWATIRSIEPIEPTPLVYDFCVPGLENFWAGTGVMAHNTYGPRMRRGDGRAVPTFVAQALAGNPLTVHGDGSQTRSLCYVDDLIEGLWRLINSDIQDPVNVGNPEEVTVRQLAEAIREATGSASEIVFTDRPVDDPEVRCPDITLARERLGWEPQVSLNEGLRRTVEWAREAWA